VEQQLRVLAREAIARGELSEQADIELLLDMLGGALLIRLFMKDARVDEVLISRIADVLLQGAPAPTARPPAPRLSRPRRAG
jgi:predicted nucleotidyltransferase